MLRCQPGFRAARPDINELERASADSRLRESRAQNLAAAFAMGTIDDERLPSLAEPTSHDIRPRSKATPRSAIA
jgi:hypothetical protein